MITGKGIEQLPEFAIRTSGSEKHCQNLSSLPTSLKTFCMPGMSYLKVACNEKIVLSNNYYKGVLIEVETI